LKSIGWEKGAEGIWRDADGKSYNFIIAAPSDWQQTISAGEVIAEQLTAFGLPTKFKATDSSIYWGNVDKGNGCIPQIKSTEKTGRSDIPRFVYSFSLKSMSFCR